MADALRLLILIAAIWVATVTFSDRNETAQRTAPYTEALPGCSVYQAEDGVATVTDNERRLRAECLGIIRKTEKKRENDLVVVFLVVGIPIVLGSLWKVMFG